MKFEDWIAGFEDRYTEEQLWYMKWIWGIQQSKIDKLEKENENLRYEKALSWVDSLESNNDRTVSLSEDDFPEIEEEE